MATEDVSGEDEPAAEKEGEEAAWEPGPVARRRRGGKRLAVALSFAVAFALGAPVWYCTTSLNRPDLPHEAMLNARHHTAALPALVRLWICTAKPKSGGMATGAGNHVDLLLEALRSQGADLLHGQALQVSAVWVTKKGCQPADPLRLLMGRSPKPIVDSVGSSSGVCPDVMKHLTQEGATGDDAIEARLYRALRGSGQATQEGVYDVFLLEGTSGGPLQQKAVVGKGRVAWVLGPMWRDLPDGPGRAAFRADMAEAAAAICMILWNGQGRLAGNPSIFPLVDTQGLSLQLSLCNADPRSGSCGWDAHWLESAALQPVATALTPIGRIEVNSQVLQHTRAMVVGIWDDEHQAYLLQPHQIPFLVDSEWNLEPDRAVVAGGYHSSINSADETSTSPGSALHFVVYVPPPEQRPLRIRTTEPSATPGLASTFSISSWGGVTLLDPAQGCCEGPAASVANATTETDSSVTRCSSHRLLEKAELVVVAQSIVTQLRASFGLGSSPSLHLPSAEVSTLPARQAGFAAWEVDLLVKRQVQLNLRSVASTLESLSRLVASLPNLDIPDEVATLVGQALVLVDEVIAASAVGNYSQSAEASRVARVAADAAFFHPSIMAEHSYPAAHLVAMYMPYFLPISVPVLRAVYKEVARRFRSPPCCGGASTPPDIQKKVQ